MFQSRDSGSRRPLSDRRMTKFGFDLPKLLTVGGSAIAKQLERSAGMAYIAAFLQRVGDGDLPANPMRAFLAGEFTGGQVPISITHLYERQVEDLMQVLDVVWAMSAERVSHEVSVIPGVGGPGDSCVVAPPAFVPPVAKGVVVKSVGRKKKKERVRRRSVSQRGIEFQETV